MVGSKNIMDKMVNNFCDRRPINKWLEENIWNLLITAISIIVMFTIMQGEIKNHNVRLTKVEAKQDSYPSVEYFELRFMTLEKQLDEIKSEIKNNQ